jgi:hypothetical protein
LRGLRGIPDFHIAPAQIAHDGRQQGTAGFIRDDFRNAMPHGGDQRIRGAEINADRKLVLVRRGGHAGFGNLKQGHSVQSFKRHALCN